MSQVILEAENIWKSFNGVSVLKGVGITLNKGEVHSILGGNGSGKSTLMKIISGVYQRDAGKITMNGEEVLFQNPAQAHLGGIYLVPQEPKIFPHLTIEENILVGTAYRLGEKRNEIAEIGKSIGFYEDLSAVAGILSIANQQLLEIVRGLLRQASVLILDEPTSTLTFKEVELLFERLNMLKERGIGIFFISHRLNEILTISDRVSVLRDGEFVLLEDAKNLDQTKLVQAMLPEGKSETVMEHEEKQDHVQDHVVFAVEHLCSEAFNDISFEVRAGEVVGLAGVVGAGRTELAEAIIGIQQSTGTLIYCGEELTERTPRRCQDRGLVYVPEDRAAHGIFLDQPNIFTTSASILRKLGRIFLNKKQEESIGNEFKDMLKIKIHDLKQIASTLSGGNQQKVVLSRVMACRPKLIILDEPTRGVDADARLDVYEIIRKLTKSGVGMLLISSDLEEIKTLSDRILIMYRGRLTHEYRNTQDCTIEQITAGAFGV